MNKFVKTFQKLTALFIILNAIPKEVQADKQGEWHNECNTGGNHGCIRFPGGQSVTHYPKQPITTERYLFPRDNPVSASKPIDMTKLIQALGKHEIAMETYRIPGKSSSRNNSCFLSELHLDRSIWNTIPNTSPTIFQLKEFPYLGFTFRVRSSLSGQPARVGENNFLQGWHNINDYENEFRSGCGFTTELRITPIMEITPKDLSHLVHDFQFPSGDIDLKLQNAFFGAFSLDGYSRAGPKPVVTEDAGTTINGNNVNIRLSAVTCLINGQANHERDFGTKKSSDITAPITTKPVDIRVDCGAATYIEPWIVFTDNNDTGNVSSTLKMVYTDDRAKIANVGIRLKQKNGNYIEFGPDSPKKGTQNQIKLTKEFAQQNRYIITFTPELIKLNASQKIDGGQLEGLATYTLSYQ
ncbi:fimbrial protein [Haemophilus influenzae]|uniref:F17d-G fimbrial adhesin n=1 Tax=Haemophilus influenzae TaxID=727 RepID=A0AB37B5U8_HAEIF|nr:fimbrial protein [Haemophilus influenzae]PRJ24253.1 F17d-G fimbrial adhesin precursor [Haemophilus influenzae]PRM81990.1 F17d-G fimbrial adhesin precursor [Haemophilus influenzae]